VRWYGEGVSITAAFDAVPREAFVPDLVWVRGDDGWAVPLRRQDDPDAWLALVHSDDAVTTQIDDGATDKGVWPTSSCSAPHVVREMLELLDLERGHRVLEVGTGTGWNAALMAQIVGAEKVTTIEIDPAIAEQAQENLDAVGCSIRVITGDGVAGYPDNAPYDRVIVTAAVAELPYAWVQQTRPRGLLLVPWAPTFHPDSPFAHVKVRAMAGLPADSLPPHGSCRYAANESPSLTATPTSDAGKRPGNQTSPDSESP
jgi:protein-L-isoaspartate(D-aspartate) O-methyltransferase